MEMSALPRPNRRVGGRTGGSRLYKFFDWSWPRAREALQLSGEKSTRGERWAQGDAARALRAALIEGLRQMIGEDPAGGARD
jgi:hypothetical protein